MELTYNPEFDSLLTKKVPQTALTAGFGTFVNFLIARYAFGFFVCEQIFLIFFIVTVCRRGKPCIGADNKAGHVKLIDHFFLKRGIRVFCSLPFPGDIPKAMGMPSESMNSPISTIGRGRFSLLAPYCLSSSACSISK